LPLAAIISDTHLPRGRREIPPACWRRLRDADLIIHAGDVSTLGVLEQLKALGPLLVGVRGNRDEPALRELLPTRAVASLGRIRLGVVHDAGPRRGRLTRLRSWFPSCAAAIYGHSHIPLHEEQDGFQIFNPGSPTDPRRQPERTMGLARAGDSHVAFEIVTLGCA
jgi:uncharacterized protein